MECNFNIIDIMGMLNSNNNLNLSIKTVDIYIVFELNYLVYSDFLREALGVHYNHINSIIDKLKISFDYTY
ncbi:MAG: hypothetical protein LBT66_01385, partial [Methanobrevibacter sp.]|nr:hypothetical protein [Candidatus Methanovirga meridionalis]